MRGKMEGGGGEGAKVDPPMAKALKVDPNDANSNAVISALPSVPSTPSSSPTPLSSSSRNEKLKNFLRDVFIYLER